MNLNYFTVGDHCRLKGYKNGIWYRQMCINYRAETKKEKTKKGNLGVKETLIRNTK